MHVTLSAGQSKAELLAAFWDTPSVPCVICPGLLWTGCRLLMLSLCPLQKHDDTQLLGMQLAVKAYRSAVIAAALAGGAVPDGAYIAVMAVGPIM